MGAVILGDNRFTIYSLLVERLLDIYQHTLCLTDSRVHNEFIKEK